MTEDVIMVDISKTEARTIAIALMILQQTNLPAEIQTDVISFASKMEAAIAAQKLTDWEKRN